MSQSQSPTPQKKNEIVEGRMSFPDAMKAIINGEKITKLEWEYPDTYCFLNGEFLSIHNGKKPGTHAWIVSDGDLIGMDWVII